MATFADIISAAQFRADLVNSDRVNTTEWRVLLGDAIRSAWEIASAARPDFQVMSADSTLVSGGSASFTVPSRFHSMIDVVFAPDTTSEYSLGPFAWQNRRSPGGWAYPPFGSSIATGGTRVRLMGPIVYVEPSQQAGGTYRLWYCPKPKAPDEPSFTVRLATTAGLNVTGGGGAGVGHTLTSNVLGALTVDGVLASPGDRILVKDQPSPFQPNNGIYIVTNVGSVGTFFVLTRASDYDQNAEIALRDLVLVTEGTVNASTIWELTSFGSIDVDPMVFSAASIDDVLAPFKELLVISTALPAVIRDDDLDPRPLEARRQVIENEMRTYFRQVRTVNGPSKIVDTDARRGWSGYGGGW